MAERLDVSRFLTLLDSLPILDVRSPAEFKKGHIPRALSLPLFTDEERAVIGTLYKQEGKKPAIKKGLEVVGPKMSQLVQSVEDMNTSHVGMYCWRGGMRSESVAWLMERYGIEVTLLEGGYKAFRQRLMQFFNQPLPLKIISGYTGSKKTELLHRIRAYGGQIVDLEGLANHQGSSFGNQKSESQPSTEHFQNTIYEAFRSLDLTRPIYLEDECQRIGQVSLMDPLFAQMRSSKHLLIEVPKKERVDFLIKDYGCLKKEQLIQATQAIERKLGPDNTQTAVDAIQKGDLHTAVNILLGYYDKRYMASRQKKEEYFVSQHKMKMNEIDLLAKQLAYEEGC